MVRRETFVFVSRLDPIPVLTAGEMTFIRRSRWICILRFSGGAVMVPTLDGAVRLKIPPETQNGQRFRLRDRGMPQLNNPDVRGALYVEVAVRLPTGLTPQQRSLFEELERMAE